MDADRFARLDELFDAVLDVPAPDRRRVFAERGADETTIREVEELLAAAEGDTSWIDRPASALPRRAEDARQPLPERIGPYRPIQVIGRGGMAVVYLAERADGHFEQTVALKLVPAGADSGEIVARFARERQILASLEHPSIARLLEGGVADDGRPYFAMERVEGLPIDRHCDEARSSVEARLRLFCEVARAVDFAHRRLVLHRDLKPSNILVTPEGRPKLLDFGIATVLESPGAQQRTVGGWMTPEYASPEQIRGEAMSTASDVYQLGLLLYELLTGRRPYEVPSRTPSEVERVICRVAPTRPSEAVRASAAGSEQAAQAAAASRNTTPRRLAQRLRGDLDLVLLQCLRKEPHRRYRSAEALAQDIERHLAGLPVAAHPESLLYTAGKFARRHRAALAAAALLVGLGTWSIGVTLYQGRVVRLERDRARAEAAKSSAIQTFLVDLFRTASPDQSLGEEVTVRQALDRGAPRIDAAFPAQPAVRAELLGATGDIYRALGRYDQADELLRRALAASAEAGAEEPVCRASALRRLGSLRRVEGRLDEAERLLRESLELATRELGAEHLAVAETLETLGATLSEQRRQDDAEPLIARALEIRRAAHGSDFHEDVASSLSHLAEVALDRDDFARAEELSRRSLEIRRALLPEDHSEVGGARSLLSRVLVRLDRLDEAEELQRQVVDSRLRVLGEDHPDTALALSNLGQLQHQKGDLEEAIATLQRALAIRLREPQPNRVFLAATWNDLGLVLRDAGDWEAAERHMRNAIAEIPQGHPWRRVFRFNLAGVLRPLGRYAEATTMMREILAADLETHGADHTIVAVDRWELGLGLAATNQLQEAQALLEEARRVYAKAFPEGHPLLDRLDAYRADLFRQTARLDDAEATIAPAYARLHKRYGESSPHSARAALTFARIHLARGRYGEAEPLLEAAARVFEGRGGPDAELVRRVRAELARARGA